jgi:hypothetical protein
LSSPKKIVSIDRWWWFRFTTRHRDQIKVWKCDSREFARANVPHGSAEAFLEQAKDIRSKMVHPDLIINMDEVGFSKRMMKGITKNCVFSTTLKVEPRFLEKQDSNHVSIVPAITVSGLTLTPLLISTRKSLPSEIQSTYIFSKFQYFFTPNGYLNGKATEFWIENIFVPYIQLKKLQLNLGNNALSILMMDGLKAHASSEKGITLLQQNFVKIVIIPPHTSHLYQPLDLCFNGVMKKSYLNNRTTDPSLYEKISTKIERIMKAHHTASFTAVVLGSWKAAGFIHQYNKGQLTDIQIGDTVILSKIPENNH